MREIKEPRISVLSISHVDKSYSIPTFSILRKSIVELIDIAVLNTNANRRTIRWFLFGDPNWIHPDDTRDHWQIDGNPLP